MEDDDQNLTIAYSIKSSLSNFVSIVKSNSKLRRRGFVILCIPLAAFFVGTLLVSKISSNTCWDVTKFRSYADNISSGTITSEEAANSAVFLAMMIATLGLITLNTALYAKDVHKLTLALREGMTAATNILNICYWGAILTLIFSFMILVGLLREGFWADVDHCESATLILFSVFLVLDTLMYFVVRFALQEASRFSFSSTSIQEFRRNRGYLTDLIKYVDLPVVIGLLFCLWVEHTLAYHFQYFQISVFAIGATTMHLIASQICFAIISFSDALAEAKSEATSV